MLCFWEDAGATKNGVTPPKRYMRDGKGPSIHPTDCSPSCSTATTVPPSQCHIKCDKLTAPSCDTGDTVGTSTID